jgi:selenocysteine-specific elongation factor
MNLAGVEKEKLSRGDVIARIGQDETVDTFIAKVDIVSTLKSPIKHNANLLLILGTTELQAKVRILDKDQIPPEGSAFVQFICKGKVLTRMGDHFILRLPSPQITVGGGIVLDVLPKVRKRKDKELISDLETRLRQDTSELILSELKKEGLISKKEILRSSNFSFDEIQSNLKKLEEEGKLFATTDFVADFDRWKQASEKIVAEVERTHQKFPFKIGIKMAGLPDRLRIGQSLFDHTIKNLIAEKKIVQQGIYLYLPTHRPALSDKQKELSQEILQKFASNPLSPPTKEEIQNLGDDYQEVLSFLTESRALVELKEGILLRTDDFERIKQQVVDFIKKHGDATISQLREHLGTTRKYMVPIVEKLDQTGVTQREGDKRVLPKS